MFYNVLHIHFSALIVRVFVSFCEVITTEMSLEML